MKDMIFSVFLIALILTGCNSNSERDEISKAIGADVSEGIETFRYDSGSSFHGDGGFCIGLQFENDKILEAISDDEKWETFPFDDITQVLVYGKTFETESEIRVRGPYVKDGNGDVLLPQIEKGYYRLIDRQEDDGRDILSREAMNVTFMIYDEGNETLYYCEVDT